MALSKTQISKASFSKGLTTAREAKSLTKEKLGKLVDVHLSQIGSYEKGGNSPSAEVIKKWLMYSRLALII